MAAQLTDKTLSSAPVRQNKHQIRTEATTRKLLDAAYRVFTRDGFEAAKIEEIAEMAGFSRGAFYAHYASKIDLFFALLERQANVHVSSLAASIAGMKPAKQRAALRGHFIQKAQDRQWFILLIEFKLYVLRHGKLRARSAERHRALRSKLGEWMKESFPESECGSGLRDEIRFVLEVSLTGLVLERAYDPERISDAQSERVLGQLFDCFAGSEIG